MKNYNIIFVLSFFLYVSCLSSGNQNDIQSGDENITDSDTSCNEKKIIYTNGDGIKIVYFTFS